MEAAISSMLIVKKVKNNPSRSPTDNGTGLELPA